MKISEALEKESEWQPPQNSKENTVGIDKQRIRKNGCVMFPNIPEAEAYKVLRTQILQRTREKNLRTVMITSALPGEGKTLTSINLSLALAKELNQTVLLVDCDLKKQNVHKYLGFPNENGLINYFEDGSQLKDLLFKPGIDNFSILSGGETVEDSSEYLGSQKMQELVLELKTRYSDRYIIFDTSPVLVSADCIAFSPFVDSILMVVEAGRTSIRDVKKALSLIPNEKFLGFVLNRHDAELSKYAYGYGVAET